MKGKSVEKAAASSQVLSKPSGVKKSKNITKATVSQKSKVGISNSVINLRSQDLVDVKKKLANGKNKSSAIRKPVLKTPGQKASKPFGGAVNGAKPPSMQSKGKEKKVQVKTKKEGTQKEKLKVGPKKNILAKPKMKSKKQCEAKPKTKKKDACQRDINQFIDLWSIASIGKREASLNATMKVNIMYERQTSPKKSSSTDSSPVKSSPSLTKPLAETKKCGKEDTTETKSKTLKENTSAKNKTNNSSPIKKDTSTPKKGKKETKQCVKNEPNKKTPPEKKKQSLNEKETDDRKRKSQYKIYEDEPAAKSRKKGNDKSHKGKGKKAVKKKPKKKTSVLGHSLGNIIEKSPRQASLIAKAMIAMEQEEDVPVETAARTNVFDWTEMRSCVVSEMRKMVWVTGKGDVKGQPQPKKSKSTDATSLSMGDLVDAAMPEQESLSLHNTLLKTVHEMGDARLLKEFFRSQKEDFPGEVDIEKCPTPEPPIPVKEPATPSPKKKSTTTTTTTSTTATTTHSSSPKKKPEKETIKPIVPSPTKPKPCRVATPIPQFMSGPRPSHMTSFIHHHPSTQPVYPGMDQHQSQQQSQPIKVTPYAPSSAYVYPYSPDRQQQNIFVPNPPTPLPFSADANDLVSRNYPAFTFNQMGSLSFERRGLNPYHHSHSNTYNPSLHMPIQPIGFNFQQFYQPSLQQLHSQQNLPSIQPVPMAHQQYSLVPPHSLLQPPHSLGPSMNPVRAFQSAYPPYAAPNPRTDAKQDKSCMPPPMAHTQPTMSQESQMKPIVQPLPSYRRAIPINPQVQSGCPIKPMPVNLTTNSANLIQSSPSAANLHAFSPPNQSLQVFNKASSSSSTNIIHNPQPLRPSAPPPIQMAFRPICKKETEPVLQDCDKVNSPISLESQKKAVVNIKTSSEESSMSDILHSAHSTMFSVEEKGPSTSTCQPTANQHNKQNQSVVVAKNSSPSAKNSSPSKVSQLVTALSSGPKSGDKNFNGSYSVSSILEMPNSKPKTGPKTTKSCAVNAQCCATTTVDQASKVTFIYVSPTKMSGKLPGTSLLTNTINNVPAKLPESKKPLELNMKQFPHDDKVIIIEDSEDSSDDEPLAKLVQAKPNEVCSNKPKTSATEDPKTKKTKMTSKPLKIKLFADKTKLKSPKTKEFKANLTKKDSNSKENKNSGKALTKPSKVQTLKPKKALSVPSKLSEIAKPQTKKDDGVQELVKTASEGLLTSAASGSSISSDTTTTTTLLPTKKLVKKAPVRRKSKCQAAAPPLPAAAPMVPKVKATHGWTWIGDGEWRTVPKLTMHKEEPLRQRKCYRSMKHTYGEVISVKDSVILQSDGDGGVPYVGKVSALWENLNGDMMFSMLWYYQPEHTATGREPEDGEQELFASKHREENSVACIDDKCYVLMYNEFCRMEADAVRQELGLPPPRSRLVIPALSEEDRAFLRPLPPVDICMENIWFCRYDYDIRKKIVRKPKHKKSDLRYRGPIKLVQ